MNIHMTAFRDGTPLDLALRPDLADVIEALINRLDAMEPDPDLEAGYQTFGRDGLTLIGLDADCEAEETDQDIADEPHDEEPDAESSLGWGGILEGSGLYLHTSRDDREQDVGDEGERNGWSEGGSLRGSLSPGYGSDDDEDSLGWCNNAAQLRLGEGHGDGDSTAPERHGVGFLRCGADDAEDDGTAEAEPDDEPTLGWPSTPGAGCITLDQNTLNWSGDGDEEDDDEREAVNEDGEAEWDSSPSLFYRPQLTRLARCVVAGPDGAAYAMEALR